MEYEAVLNHSKFGRRCKLTEPPQPFFYEPVIPAMSVSWIQSATVSDVLDRVYTRTWKLKDVIDTGRRLIGYYDLVEQ